MDEPLPPNADVAEEAEEFGISMPPNARIGSIAFEDAQHRLRIALADGGDERLIAAEDLRALYGARIRHVSVSQSSPKAQGVAMSSTALMATTRLPSAILDPSRRGDVSVHSEELYYAVAMRIERLPELWYLIATSFNFRKALGSDATYSTELNLREFIRRLSKLAPDAVRDGFFTAVLQGSPLPPPLESLLEFFRLVAR